MKISSQLPAFTPKNPLARRESSEINTLRSINLIPALTGMTSFRPIELFRITLFTMLCSLTFNIQAATAPIKVTSIAEIEVEVVENGKKIIKRHTPEKAVPGTEVIFTDTFENVSNKAASNIVIDNPIPVNMEYKGNSAFCTNCTIEFSVDGGRTFGAARSLKVLGPDGQQYSAIPKQYTHIRWTYQGQLSAGEHSQVGFHATIK